MIHVILKMIFVCLLLRYNWHIKLYWFQVYNIMIWYLYPLWNDHHNKSIYHLSPYIVTNYFFLFFFSCDENFQDLHSWKLSNMKNSINYSHHAIHYNPVTYLLYNWTFEPFDPLHPFHPSLTPPLPSGKHQSVLCIYEFGFLFVCLAACLVFICLFCFGFLFFWSHI